MCAGYVRGKGDFLIISDYGLPAKSRFLQVQFTTGASFLRLQPLIAYGA